MKEQFTLFRSTHLALLGNMMLSMFTTLKKVYTKLLGIPSLLGNKTLSWFTSLKKRLTLFGNMMLSWLIALKKSFTLLGNTILSWLVSSKKRLGNTVLSWTTTTKRLLNLFRKKIPSRLVTIKKVSIKLMDHLFLFLKSGFTTLKKGLTLFGNTTLSLLVTIKKYLTLLGNKMLSWLTSVKKAFTKLSGILSLFRNSTQSLLISLKKGLAHFGNTMLSWLVSTKKQLGKATLSWLKTIKKLFPFLKKRLTKLMDHLFLFWKSSLALVKKTLALFGNTTLSLLVSTKKYLTLFGKKVFTKLSDVLVLFWNATLSLLIFLKRGLTLFVSMVLSGFATTKTHATRLAGLPAFLGNTMQSGFITLKKYFIGIPSIFLLLVTVLAVFITLNGFLAGTAIANQIFNLLFIPITLYLILGFASHITVRSPVFGARNVFVKLLTFYCLVITGTLVVAGFMSSLTAPDLISSLVFAPLAVFFLISVWPHPNLTPLNPSSQRQYTPPTTSTKSNGQFDANRRDFLKMIGTAGISIFLYNLLFRRNGAPLFASSTSGSNLLTLKNAQGEVINPAERSPTQGYYITQTDDSETAYYGFINHLGQWYIMRQDIDDSYRYSKGDKDFSNNWANRTQLTYDYFDNVF